MIDSTIHNSSSFFNQVKKYISKDESNKAISLLIHFGKYQDVNKETCDNIFLISNQFENMMSREMKGLKVCSTEKNDFTKRLLDLVNYLQENFAAESSENLVRKIDKFNFKNIQRLGIYTGISVITLVAILIGTNIILSVIIGILAVILFWKFDIDI